MFVLQLHCTCYLVKQNKQTWVLSGGLNPTHCQMGFFDRACAYNIGLHQKPKQSLGKKTKKFSLTSLFLLVTYFVDDLLLTVKSSVDDILLSVKSSIFSTLLLFKKSNMDISLFSSLSKQYASHNLPIEDLSLIETKIC